MPPIESLLLLCVLLAIGWLWYRSLAAREQALAVVREVCTDMRLQALDQNVTLRRIWPCRDDNGRISVRRIYTFEFSAAGSDRHTGFIAFVGDKLQWVRLEHPDGPIIIDI